MCDHCSQNSLQGELSAINFEESKAVHWTKGSRANASSDERQQRRSLPVGRKAAVQTSTDERQQRRGPRMKGSRADVYGRVASVADPTDDAQNRRHQRTTRKSANVLRQEAAAATSSHEPQQRRCPRTSRGDVYGRTATTSTSMD